MLKGHRDSGTGRNNAMVLMIDNYDSFTYNIVHCLSQGGRRVVVRRNDSLTVEQALALRPGAVVISPGPGDPAQAGICLDLVKACAGRIPLLGVCLGHQCIGEAFGGRIVRAGRLMHGKTSPIRHDGRTLFRKMPDPFPATRYHSLLVDRASLPAELEVSAWTAEGEIMGLRHRRHLVEGVQFHPESILTKDGQCIIDNFIARAFGGRQ